MRIQISEYFSLGRVMIGQFYRCVIHEKQTKHTANVVVSKSTVCVGERPRALKLYIMHSPCIAITVKYEAWQYCNGPLIHESDHKIFSQITLA